MQSITSSSFFQFIKGSELRNRFILYFIALSAMPVLVLGGVALYLIDLSHRQDISKLEVQLIDQKVEEIEKFFADTLGILELRVGFFQRSPIPPESQIFVLEGLMEENSAFQEISFIDVGGLIANNIPTVAGKEIAKAVRAEKNISLITDATRLANISRLDSFTDPARGESFVGDVYYTLSGPMVTLSAPVRNKNNDIIQVLSAEVSLSEIHRSIKRARIGTNGYVILVDKEGAVIAHHGRGEIKPGTDLIGLSRVRAVLQGEIMDALGDQDRYISFFEGVPVVGAGKKIPKIGWGLLVEWPINDADAVMSDVRNQVVLYVLFSILAVLVLGPLFVFRLVQPIRKLQVGATEIEKGNFEKLVDIRTNDELEDLGSAFNKMAKGLKRLKELQEEFVFIAAHDLRAPVTVIKGYLSMISEDRSMQSFTDNVKDYLEQIQKANQRLEKLVKDLLEVARSEAGRIVVEVKPIDVRDPVSESVEGLRSLAADKSISLKYESLPVAELVLVDTDRLKEIMENLISNAIKYSPANATVRVFHERKPSEIITHVEDSGFGIPKEKQAKLFEKFYRVSMKETQGIGGTGLGLFIVKELITKMNGKIWFESEYGKGSTFSFSLPLARQKQV